MCLSCSCCCWRTLNAQQLKNGRKSSPVWFVAGTGTAIPLTASAPAGGCRHLSCCVSARGRHHHCHNCLMHPVSDQQLQQMQRSPPTCPSSSCSTALQELVHDAQAKGSPCRIHLCCPSFPRGMALPIEAAAQLHWQVLLLHQRADGVAHQQQWILSPVLLQAMLLS